MASVVTEQTATQTTNTSSESLRAGRGRGRGRGRVMRGLVRDRDDRSGGGGQRGDAIPGGRGGFRRPRGGTARKDDDENAHTAPGPNRTAQVTLPVAPAAPKSTTHLDTNDADSDADKGICFICADPVKYSAVAPCNHVTCHICSLRMRALYKNKMCAHCRTESEFVIFSKDESRRYEEFKESDIVDRNDPLGIKYDDQAICDDTTLLLRYNCPEPTCDRACLGWPDLHGHVKREHSRVMCDLCTRNKKVFTHEHTLFTAAELRRHERHGDDQPGAENQSGFKGHPECGFCNIRFYSADELYDHCRLSHERCFICDRRAQGSNPQYYVDYDALETHFRDAHFMCPDQECLNKHFIVFETEIDLKAHQLETHPNGLSKAARRDARRIDMSHFEGTQSQQPRDSNRRRGRGGRDATRGRQEPEDTPVRTEQQLSRAEIAFHRTQQLAIQSSQSQTVRTFGGQLSDPAFAARPIPRPTPQQTMEAPPPPMRSPVIPGATFVTSTAATAFPPLSSTSPRTTQPSQPARPVYTMTEEVRRLKHASVIERANTFVRHDAKKMELFRAYISKYRTGAVSASDLVDMLWGLFDVAASELGKLLQELAELYEDDLKRKELLKAWNSWKAINEDYPPIAGVPSTPSSSSSAAAAAASENRVLKLKSSTARSSRSTTAQSTSWGTAALSPAASYPTLAEIHPSRVGQGAVSATPWIASQAPPNSTVNTGSRATPAAARKTAAGGRKDDFPSLPPKKQIPGWTPVQSKSRWGEPQAPPPNVWGGGGNSQQQQQAEEEEGGEGDYGGEVQGGAGRKKKGKGKQLLFHVGL